VHSGDLVLPGVGESAVVKRKPYKVKSIKFKVAAGAWRHCLLGGFHLSLFTLYFEPLRFVGALESGEKARAQTGVFVPRALQLKLTGL
jgi:hypothetical protein